MPNDPTHRRDLLLADALAGLIELVSTSDSVKKPISAIDIAITHIQSVKHSPVENDYQQSLKVDSDSPSTEEDTLQPPHG